MRYNFVCLKSYTHLFAGSLTIPGHAAATLGCQHNTKTIKIII